MDVCPLPSANQMTNTRLQIYVKYGSIKIWILIYGQLLRCRFPTGPHIWLSSLNSRRSLFSMSDTIRIPFTQCFYGAHQSSKSSAFLPLFEANVLTLLFKIQRLFRYGMRAGTLLVLYWYSTGSLPAQFTILRHDKKAMSHLCDYLTTNKSKSLMRVRLNIFPSAARAKRKKVTKSREGQGVSCCKDSFLLLDKDHCGFRETSFVHRLII